MRSWEDVHRLREQEGRSARDIARTLGMSRNTVRRLLSLPEPPRYRRIPSGSSLDPFRDTILSLLEQDSRMPATVVRQRLTELGYSGGITILKNHLATVRPGFRTFPTLPRASAVPVQIDGDPDFAHLGSLETRATDPVLGADSEPGMNLISSDFEIVMVNRTNERLFQKPMVEMLGKKCFREFERRSEVCPHCPGAAALATGHPHRVEAGGIRDDGTKYAVRLTAYPILGPLGAPVGFVEVEEDITERRRSERLAKLFEDLETSLAATHDIRSAIRQALNVAFSLEGVDFGYAYILDPGTGEYRTVAQRGASLNLAEASTRRGSNPASALGPSPSAAGSGPVRSADSRGTMAVALVPIVQDDLTVARLLLGSSAYVQFPPATQAALEGLGKIVGSAIASFRARQLQREVRTEIEAFISALPVAGWCLDGANKVTLWNRAAERLFGWKADELLGGSLPISLEEVTDDAEKRARHDHGETDWSHREFECRRKGGAVVRLRVAVVPLPAVMDRSSGAMTLAEEVHGGPRQVVAGPVDPLMPSVAEIVRAPRLLVVHRAGGERTNLVRILRDMTCSIAVCDSSERALQRFCAARRSRRPFDLVIGELLTPVGPGGLALASRLLKSDADVAVILSADSPVEGYESHGLAGTIRQPYAAAAVRETISRVVEKRKKASGRTVGARP
jgi:PAS domain S-box-containing protein